MNKCNSKVSNFETVKCEDKTRAENFNCVNKNIADAEMNAFKYKSGTEMYNFLNGNDVVSKLSCDTDLNSIHPMTHKCYLQLNETTNGNLSGPFNVQSLMDVDSKNNKNSKKEIECITNSRSTDVKIEKFLMEPATVTNIDHPSFIVTPPSPKYETWQTNGNIFQNTEKTQQKQNKRPFSLNFLKPEENPEIMGNRKKSFKWNIPMFEKPKTIELTCLPSSISVDNLSSLNDYSLSGSSSSSMPFISSNASPELDSLTVTKSYKRSVSAPHEKEDDSKAMCWQSKSLTGESKIDFIDHLVKIQQKLEFTSATRNEVNNTLNKNSLSISLSQRHPSSSDIITETKKSIPEDAEISELIDCPKKRFETTHFVPSKRPRYNRM